MNSKRESEGKMSMMIFSPDGNGSIASPYSRSYETITPKKKLNLSLDVAPSTESPDDLGYHGSMPTALTDIHRTPLSEINGPSLTPTTRQVIKSEYEKASLSVEMENPLSTSGRNASEKDLTDSGVFVKPKVPFQRPKSLIPYSDGSPKTVENFLLKQIESPLGHMSLCSPTPSSPLTKSLDLTHGGAQSDGYSEELFNYSEAHSIPSSVSSLMSAPIQSGSKRVDNSGQRRNGVPWEPGPDFLKERKLPCFHRASSMSHFETQRASLKRSSPFEPDQMAKRAAPPLPSFGSNYYKQGNSNQLEEDLATNSFTCSPLEPGKIRSLSTDTPKSSSKRTAKVTLLRSMSVSMLNSPPLIHSEEVECEVSMMAKRAAPPLPFGSSYYKQGNSNQLEEDLVTNSDTYSPLEPFKIRSLSTDTPKSSSKQTAKVTLLRSMSVSMLNSPPLIHSEEVECEVSMIGDESRPYCLPILKGGKHPDLKCISTETVCKLLSGDFKEAVQRFTVIDARYPYEYAAGHIKNAVNIWENEQLERHFFSDPAHKDITYRDILIFHCEFSSKRGPALNRHLRKFDRKLNGMAFPKLYYPEIYLLQGGYKKFFEEAQAFCSPQGYRPMDHVDHKDDYKKFAKRSKSWAGDRGKRRPLFPSGRRGTVIGESDGDPSQLEASSKSQP